MKSKIFFVGRSKHELRRTPCRAPAACRICCEHGGHAAYYRYESGRWTHIGARLPGAPAGFEPSPCARRGCACYVGPGQRFCSPSCRRAAPPLRKA
jgi:hypothetical protein